LEVRFVNAHFKNELSGSVKPEDIMRYNKSMKFQSMVLAAAIFVTMLFPCASRAGDFETLKAAIELRDIDKVRSALVYGADANARNSAGDAALFYAVLSGNKDIVRLLLDRGADINAKNNEGWTALMTATTSGNIEMVKYLLDNGADPLLEANLKGAGKRTALSIAKIKKRNDIIELLSKTVPAGKTVSSENYISPTTPKAIDAYKYMRALKTVNRLLAAWVIRDKNIKEFFSRKMLIDKVNDGFCDEFIGLSNPHNQAFEITGGRKLGEKEFEFDVKLYYLYSNDPESSSGVTGKIRVVNEDDFWLVDRWGF